MLNKKIDCYIKERGIRKTIISQKTGINYQSLVRSLSGEQKMSFEQYAKICNFLDLPYDYFIKEEKSSK